MTLRTNTKLAKSVGRAIAKKRLMVGLTQAQVAESLGVSNDALSRMERGNIVPTLSRLAQLADIFGCETAELLTESSYVASDHARRITILLEQLNENERMQLLTIMETMISWHVQNKK